jgi:pimeloyl-ACP methyl ester carboxylesterase
MLELKDIELRRVSIPGRLALNVALSPRMPGLPLLLLPAYADSWWSWSRVLPPLADRRTTIAVDTRGHGDSDRPECCYAMDDVVADLVGLLDVLEIDRAVVVGHSGSCFAARGLAIAHPERVAGLGLISSPVALDRELLGSFVETIKGLADPVAETFIRDFQAGAAPVALPTDFLDGLVAESRKLPARVWRDALAGLLAYRDEALLDEIRAPTTLMWGDRDEIVSRADQERLRTAIGDAELIVMAETGLSPHWERPDEVIPMLFELVDRAD